MSQKHRQKLSTREAKQARQGKRVVNGIFMALIILMILLLIGYSLLNN
ncbi:MAG: hypothetical protein RR386_01380 [Bacteroidaceae bacterium]